MALKARVWVCFFLHLPHSPPVPPATRSFLYRPYSPRCILPSAVFLVPSHLAFQLLRHDDLEAG